MSNHLLDIERPYKQGDPLDMEDAREASRRSSVLRRQAEAELRAAVEDRAEKEGAYRKALAQKIVELRSECSATEAKERARGEEPVVSKMIEFRVAEGMVDAHKERLKTIEGDRSQLKSLVDYSAGVRAALREAEDRPATETHGSGKPRRELQPAA